MVKESNQIIEGDFLTAAREHAHNCNAAATNMEQISSQCTSDTSISKVPLVHLDQKLDWTVERVKSLPQITKDIGESLPEQHRLEKRENRMYLIKVLSTIKYLARQGLAFRGDNDDSNFNFVQLLKLRSLNDPRIQNWMKRSKDFTSPELLK